MASVVIQDVQDLGAVWPELETLIRGIIDYHRPWDQRPLRPDWATRMREFMQGQTTLLARTADGEAVAFLNGSLRRDYGIFEETVGFVNNAFVVESWRRQAVGSELLQRFERWCAQQGATEVRLDVTSGNDLGMGFWLRHGFEPAHTTLKKTLGGGA